MINFFTDQHTNWSLLSLTYYYIHTEKYIYRQLMALDGVVTNWIKGVFLNFFSTEIGKTAHKMALELTKEISRNAETWTVGKTGKTGFLEKKITTACRTRNSKLGKWVFWEKVPDDWENGWNRTQLKRLLWRQLYIWTSPTNTPYPWIRWRLENAKGILLCIPTHVFYYLNWKYQYR